MDIKDLDKKQLVLLTFLITFVVSIATGIVTVSLMNQMPKNVPQTINNVIQRTIEKVSTVETPSTTTSSSSNNNLVLGDGDTIVPIYKADAVISSKEEVKDTNTNNSSTISEENKELGQGVIISEVGLVLVDSSVLSESQNYKIVLNKKEFNASVLKKFSNGFTILKISEKKSTTETKTDTNTTKATQ